VRVVVITEERVWYILMRKRGQVLALVVMSKLDEEDIRSLKVRFSNV
jgi:hypothetical protein